MSVVELLGQLEPPNHQQMGSLARPAAKSMLADLEDDAVDRAKVTARVIDEYVHDNPWQSIGAAAAIGFLVGIIVVRR